MMQPGAGGGGKLDLEKLIERRRGSTGTT